MLTTQDVDVGIIKTTNIDIIKVHLSVSWKPSSLIAGTSLNGLILAAYSGCRCSPKNIDMRPYDRGGLPMCNQTTARGYHT